MLFFNNCKKMDLSFSLLFLFLFVFIKTRCLREYSFKYYSFNTKNRAAMAVSCNKDRNMVIWGSLFGQLQLTVNKLFNLCVFLFRCYCSGQTFSLLSRFEIFRSCIKTRYFFLYYNDHCIWECMSGEAGRMTHACPLVPWSWHTDRSIWSFGCWDFSAAPASQIKISLFHTVMHISLDEMRRCLNNLDDDMVSPVKQVHCI